MEWAREWASEWASECGMMEWVGFDGVGGVCVCVVSGVASLRAHASRQTAALPICTRAATSRPRLGRCGPLSPRNPPPPPHTPQTPPPERETLPFTRHRIHHRHHRHQTPQTPQTPDTTFTRHNELLPEAKDQRVFVSVLSSCVVTLVVRFKARNERGFE